MELDRVKLNRKYNLGNYETIDVGFEAETNEQDNPLDVLKHLEDMAELYLQARTAKTEQKPQPKPQPKPKPELKVDATSLAWETVQTENPFEITKQQEHESFKLLKAKVDEKHGKPVYVDGYVYWMMMDEKTLARRKK